MDGLITLGTIVAGNDIVDLPTAKKNSNIEWSDTDHDAFLNVLLAASVDDAEQYTGLNLVARTGTTLDVPEFFEILELPFGPVRALTAAIYYDINGDSQAMDPANDFVLEPYRAGSVQRLFCNMTVFPSLDPDRRFAIKLTFDTGFLAANIPAAVKSAVLMRFSNKEMYREDVPEVLNRSFHAALRPFRKW